MPRKRLQGSNTDLLLCTVSLGHEMPLLTTDAVFQRYMKVIPVSLHAAS